MQSKAVRYLLMAFVVALAGLAITWQVVTDVSPNDIERLRMAGADSVPRLKLIAARGNPLAQKALAQLLLRQPGRQAEARAYASSAAALGEHEAAWILGRALFDGSGTDNGQPDMPQARAWLEKAAKAGHADAMYRLALMYKNGYGGTQDWQQGASWLARAVKLGHADAMFMLANAYHDGQGVARDEQQALRLYQAAAEKEQPLAAQMLAQAYAQGRLGLKQDQHEAELMMREVEHILAHHGE